MNQNIASPMIQSELSEANLGPLGRSLLVLVLDLFILAALTLAAAGFLFSIDIWHRFAMAFFATSAWVFLDLWKTVSNPRISLTSCRLSVDFVSSFLADFVRIVAVALLYGLALTLIWFLPIALLYLIKAPGWWKAGINLWSFVLIYTVPLMVHSVIRSGALTCQSPIPRICTPLGEAIKLYLVTLIFLMPIVYAWVHARPL
jgi:hypothetical protein